MNDSIEFYFLESIQIDNVNLKKYFSI